MFRRSRAAIVPSAAFPAADHQASVITRPLTQPEMPSQYEHARHLTASLPPDALAILVEAAAPLLFGRVDPYAPQVPRAQQLAQWLSDAAGLLTPVSAGYVAAYRPTALACCVVWWLLVDSVQARRAATPAQTVAPTSWSRGWRR
jgi:hypothetical protein